MNVTVLGAGIVGLTTAVRLLERGCAVRVVAAGPTETCTSYLAAGIWFPTHVGPAGRVGAWGRRTYAVLAEHAARGVPGALMRESLALYRAPPGRPAWADAVGHVRPASAGELPAGYAHGLRFVAPLAEMPVYLSWLEAAVVEGGAALVRRTVGSVDELAEPGVDVVVNCSGLAARHLASDPSVYPVRGQVVRVANPGLHLSVRDEGHPGGRTYVHPRTADCILGGTLEAGSWDTEVDPATADAILERCVGIVPELAGTTVLEHLAGLRPGRPAVRLEEAAGRRHGTRIVHNYGHGGAGVTLAWGCAEDVADLVTGGRR